MELSRSLGVRKGAWTREEDILLRNCIQKHGEGKWHLVPLKAGLNRCRKSCRLRWLNYLKPDIKRGDFAVDEVALLIRLHKLLGNRWSLIAGRLPGRTANDVKNYWNTHMIKKVASPKEKGVANKNESTTKAALIKPRARTFSKNLHEYCSISEKSSNIPSTDTNLSHPLLEVPPLDDGIQWWDHLLDDKEAGGDDGWCFGSKEDPLETFSAQQDLGQDSVPVEQNSWGDFRMDMDIWKL